jgi:hypothetical protein
MEDWLRCQHHIRHNLHFGSTISQHQRLPIRHAHQRIYLQRLTRHSETGLSIVLPHHMITLLRAVEDEVVVPEKLLGLQIKFVALFERALLFLLKFLVG